MCTLDKPVNIDTPKRTVTNSSFITPKLTRVRDLLIQKCRVIVLDSFSLVSDALWMSCTLRFRKLYSQPGSKNLARVRFGPALVLKILLIGLICNEFSAMDTEKEYSLILKRDTLPSPEIPGCLYMVQQASFGQSPWQVRS